MYQEKTNMWLNKEFHTEAEEKESNLIGKLDSRKGKNVWSKELLAR